MNTQDSSRITRIKRLILKAFRCANMMSRKDFASYIGISAVYLAQLENGVKENLSDKMLKSILESMNLTEEHFCNIMLYAITIDTNLQSINNLTDEEKQRILKQEIIYAFLNLLHEENVKNGFIKRCRIPTNDTM